MSDQVALWSGKKVIFISGSHAVAAAVQCKWVKMLAIYVVNPCAVANLTLMVVYPLNSSKITNPCVLQIQTSIRF